MTLSASTAVGTSYEQLGAPKSQASLEIFLMHCEVPRSHLQTLHQLKDSVPPPTTRREQIRLANVWGRISACLAIRFWVAAESLLPHLWSSLQLQQSGGACGSHRVLRGLRHGVNAFLGAVTFSSLLLRTVPIGQPDCAAAT